MESEPGESRVQDAGCRVQDKVRVRVRVIDMDVDMDIGADTDAEIRF